ncbi:MAG: leucine-rich repeat domain-containing protein, partial [Candidatus Izemoplasmatales bacterium]
IGPNAFKNCSSLDIDALPESLVAIGAGAFYGVGGTESILIPESVTTIGDGALANMDSLTTVFVDIENEMFKAQDGVLYDSDYSALIVYPLAKPGADFDIPETVTTIRPFAFSGSFGEIDDGLRNVYIPAQVTTIGEGAFSGSDVTIRVEAVEKPSGWHFYWSEGSKTVIWGYSRD